MLTSMMDLVNHYVKILCKPMALLVYIILLVNIGKTEIIDIVDFDGW